MNQVITIKWWDPDPAKDVPEKAKNELQTEATIHIHRMIDQGYTSGDLNCHSVDGTRYQGWWELYSSDRNNLTRKIYDDIETKLSPTYDTVHMSDIQEVLEKYLGQLS